MLAQTVKINPVHIQAVRPAALLRAAAALMLVTGLLSVATGSMVLLPGAFSGPLQLFALPMILIGLASFPIGYRLHLLRNWAALACTACAFALAFVHISWLIVSSMQGLVVVGHVVTTGSAMLAALLLPCTILPSLALMRRRRRLLRA